jgi:hypothetical protein
MAKNSIQISLLRSGSGLDPLKARSGSASNGLLLTLKISLGRYRIQVQTKSKGRFSHNVEFIRIHINIIYIEAMQSGMV